MDNHIIKFIDGSTLEITAEDYRNIIGKEGLIVLKSVGQSLNTSSISRIVPKSKADELEDKKNQKEGTLYDGTPVIRYFGSWYLDGEFDENGKPLRRIDSSYHPEVQRDCVPTRKEFELKYRALPRKERLRLICQGTKEPRVGKLEKVGGLLGGVVDRLTNKKEVR